MDKEKIIIVGTGTNARHAFEFIQMYDLYEILGFAVSNEYIDTDSFMGYPLYDVEKLHLQVSSDFKVFVALLWNRLNSDRRKLFELCESIGYKFANLVSPHAIIRNSSVIGRNCWIHDFAVIQNNTIIGDDVAIMAYSLIGADCHVGSHCFFGARSLLGGGSSIGVQSFVGLNATIFDDTVIGEKCIIGACTSVKRNMPSFSKYITSSDDIVIKQYAEEEIESKLQFKNNKR